MNKDRLQLAIPLAHSPLTDTPTPEARLEVELALAPGEFFELEPIAGLLLDNTISPVQWYLNDDRPIKVTVRLVLPGGDPLEGTIDSYQTSLQLGLGEIAHPAGKAKKYDILLQGSLHLPVTFADSASSTKLWAELKKLWPTGEQADILKLCIEPAGLYIRGNLPIDLFPSGVPERSLILRVPQHPRDYDYPPDEDSKQKQFFWSLESFQFPDAMTATKFIQHYAEDFQRFAIAADQEDGQESPRTFIDNLVCQPQPRCVVKIFRDKDLLKWVAGSSLMTVAAAEDFTPLDVLTSDLQAGDLGTRIMIGTGSGTNSEAAFYPQQLTGAFNLKTGKPQPVRFEAGQKRATSDPIRLQLSRSTGRVKLSFPKQELFALKVPLVSLAEPQPTAHSASATPYRAWLCTETGWLSLDVAHPEVEVDPNQSTQGAITSDIPLHQLLQSLNQEAESSVEIDLKALKDSYVAIELDDHRSNNPKLALILQDPMVTLSTAAVWVNAQAYVQKASEDGSANDWNNVIWKSNQLPFLTLEGLSRTENPLLVSGSFISENAVTKTLESRQETVALQIEYQEQQGFLFSFPTQHLTLWHRPTQYPIVQNFPLSFAANSGTLNSDSNQPKYLNSDRGLIPYRVSDPAQAEWIALTFPPNRLPFLREPETLPTLFPLPTEPSFWSIPPEYDQAHWFLPTLPGVELTVAQQFNQSTWSYRHAVPVLDEAYAEVTEIPRTDVNPTLYTGIDFTRVVGTQAFTFSNAVPQRVKATGWLPRTPANPTGEVELELTRIELDGRSPRLDFNLAGKRFFDRNAAALDGVTLKLTSDNDHPRLPSFQVELNGGEGPAIINNGQPLIAQWNQDTKRIITLDGEGTLREEPIGGLSQYRLLRDGILSDRQRITRTHQLGKEDLGDKLQLELAGISIAQISTLTLEELAQESWMLHDGSGDYPILRGFPLYPLQLESYAYDTNSHIASVSIVAIWMPSKPSSSAELPDFATDTIKLKFEGAIDNPLQLISITGMIDWRFLATKGNQASVYLTRLKAKIDAEFIGAGTAKIGLILSEIAVAHPVGLLRFTDLEKQQAGITRLCFIEREEAESYLWFELDYATEVFHHRLKIDQKILKSETIADVALSSYRFCWTNQSTSTEVDTYWNLISQLNDSQHDDKKQLEWCLQLKRRIQGNQEFDLLGELPMTAQAIAPRKLLFKVEHNTFLQQESLWFKLDKVVSGIVGVEFEHSKPEPGKVSHLIVRHLAIELQLLHSDPNPDDAIQLWDPDGETLQTLDFKTGTVSWVVSPSKSKAESEINISFRNRKGLLEWKLLTNTDKVSTAQEDRQAEDVLRAVPIQDDKNWLVLVVKEDNQQTVLVRNLGRKDGKVFQSGRTVNEPLESSSSAITVLASNWRLEDDRRVAWARDDNTVRVWSLGKNFEGQATQLERTNPHGKQKITAIDFDSDGNIISATNEGNIIVWNPEEQNPTPLLQADHRILITSLAILEGAILQDGLMIVADAQSKVTIWKTVIEGGAPKIQSINQSIHHPDFDIAQVMPLGTRLSNNGTSEITEQLFAILIKPSEANQGASVAQVIQYALQGEQITETKVLDLGSCIPNFLSLLKVEEDDEDKLKLLITGTSSCTRLSSILKYQHSAIRPEDTIVELELTGCLSVRNEIPFKKGNQRATHRINIYLDQAKMPLSTLFQGEGPAEDFYIGAIVEHTFRLHTDKQYLQDYIWQVPQLVRLTQLGRAESYLQQTISDETRSSLLIDASAVFWLQADLFPAQLRYNAGTAKVENPHFQLLLQPQEIRQFEVQTSHIMRLPMLSSPVLADIKPIQLKRGQSYTQATSGNQAMTLEPTSVLPKMLPVPPLPIEDQTAYSDRRSQSTWLNTDFLRYTMLPEPDQRYLPIQKSTAQLDRPGLMPLFSDRSTPELPEELTDLSGLWQLTNRNNNPSYPNNVLYCSAAAIVRKHEPDAAQQTLSGATLFEFPFWVYLKNSTISTSSDAENVQLISFEEGIFKRLASDHLNPTTAQAWAKRVLENRRRANGAVILKNYQEVVPISRTTESFQEELRYAHPWFTETILLPSSSSRPIDVDFDPRCRMPEPNGISALQADSSLGLLLLEARPAKSVPEIKQVAATQFRLVPTSEAALNNKYAGGLRPARAASLFTLTFQERVAFEQTQQGQYPIVDARTQQERPLPNLQSSNAEEATTIVPPLIDVVSWAARPGEIMQSSWFLNQVDGDPKRLRAAQPSMVSLRRPRAKAGSRESVQLELVLPDTAGADSQKIDPRFQCQRLKLKQTVDISTVTDSVEMVLVTRSDVFRSAKEPDAAQTNPSRIVNSKDQKRFDLYLVAKELSSKLVSAALIVVSDPDPDRQAPPYKGQVAAPEDIFLQPTNVVQVPIPTDTQVVCWKVPETLNNISTTPAEPITIDLVSYAWSNNGTSWDYETQPLASIALAFLESGSIITPPRTSIALLSYSKPGQPEENVALSGYGRLEENDFNLIQPMQQDMTIDWVRTVEIMAIDRLSEINQNPEAYEYDAVVYGSGGETIPTRA